MLQDSDASLASESSDDDDDDDDSQNDSSGSSSVGRSSRLVYQSVNRSVNLCDVIVEVPAITSRASSSLQEAYAS